VYAENLSEYDYWLLRKYFNLSVVFVIVFLILDLVGKIKILVIEKKCCFVFENSAVGVV
jgi:hypothetical protein